MSSEGDDDVMPVGGGIGTVRVGVYFSGDASRPLVRVLIGLNCYYLCVN